MNFPPPRPEYSKGRPKPPSSLTGFSLYRFDIFCLPAFGALDHVELHLLTLLQAAEPSRLDGGEMHENILSVLSTDEPIALGIIEPLHRSCFHCGTFLLC